MNLSVNVAYGTDIDVAIGAVREVIHAPRITRVPRAPDYITGVINLRGQVVATLADGVAMAEDALGSGLAAEKLKEFIDFTRLLREQGS